MSFGGALKMALHRLCEAKASARGIFLKNLRIAVDKHQKIFLQVNILDCSNIRMPIFCARVSKGFEKITFVPLQKIARCS